jgi:hypothetical protein
MDTNSSHWLSPVITRRLGKFGEENRRPHGSADGGPMPAKEEEIRRPLLTRRAQERAPDH